ncbi:MAG: hypothetical protein OEX00_10400 [Gammaproteobacteria bacterium]|nr:hypothetical protein [Gammaproteobacteria bacterium]MDH5692655.1 hypothetical protein [Gammaproteobacteria bacterium]
MNIGKTFSLLFVNLCIAAYYKAKLKSTRPDSGAFSRLVNLLLEGPRLYRVEGVAHYQGHCYSIDLPLSLLSDEHGLSSLLLLENDRLIFREMIPSLQEIVEKGSGRYLHYRDKLFFSPIDNATPNQITRKQYQILETYTNDVQINQTLLELFKRRTALGSELLYLLKKFELSLAGKFSFQNLDQQSESEIRLSNAVLDLAQWGLGNWSFKDLILKLDQQQDKKVLQLEFNDARAHESPHFSGSIALAYYADYRLELQSLHLSVDGSQVFNLTCDWKLRMLDKAKVGITRLAGLRKLFLSAFSNSQEQYSSWLNAFVKDWQTGDLTLPCQLDEKTAKDLLDRLSADSRTTDLELLMQREQGKLQLVLDCETNSCEAL